MKAKPCWFCQGAGTYRWDFPNVTYTCPVCDGEGTIKPKEPTR